MTKRFSFRLLTVAASKLGAASRSPKKRPEKEKQITRAMLAEAMPITLEGESVGLPYRKGCSTKRNMRKARAIEAATSTTLCAGETSPNSHWESRLSIGQW